MTLYVGAREAARRLGVTRATLYAYVSRQQIERRTAVDGRSSLYSVDDIERLANRARRREPLPRPSIDVQITSAVTRLDEHGLRYRGHDVVELCERASFEQVAELLWSGTLPPDSPRWPAVAADDAAVVATVVKVLGAAATHLSRLQVLAAVLGVRHPDDPAAVAARRVANVAPLLDDRPRPGSLAERLARAWHPSPPPRLAAAIDRALVLLADHELATSTLAVRVAASVRTDAYAALVAGLTTVSGRLHGSAAAAAHGLLVEAAERGAVAAIARRRAAGERLPGFGHTVYRTGDPRLAPLLDAVRRMPDPDDHLAVVDAVLHEAGRVVVQRPNVDFGLAALSYVAGLDPDVPIFAVARLAGWAAHFEEELAERPVRYRGLARVE